jgi:ABC-type sugar transport system ATPase subunit
VKSFNTKKVEMETFPKDFTDPSQNQIGLTVVGVTKSFDSVEVLSKVTMNFAPSRISGIVGENGAGKSTLLKILAGYYPHGAFFGQLYFNNEKLELTDVRDSKEKGIVLISQELHIAQNLSIAENMFAGELPNKNGVINKKEMKEKAIYWLSFFGINVDPEKPMSFLSPPEQRLCLIASALSQNAKVLILDEPTASLSHSESQLLFDQLNHLKEKSITIVFVSHRLDDIEQICDTIYVLRNGRHVNTFYKERYSRAEIIESILGQKVGNELSELTTSIVSNGEISLKITNLKVWDKINRIRVDGVSIRTEVGEIVGMFGLVGAGRTELVHSIFGMWKGTITGEIEVSRKPYKISSPHNAIRNGLALLTEDRRSSGVFTGHSLKSNLGAVNMNAVSKRGFILKIKESIRAQKLIKDLDIRAQSENQLIEYLSGGNQQKVVLGRWLAASPEVLILDEPTAGVDIGAREDIYQLIEQLAREGKSILVISSDLDEVIRVCQRIYVMHRGNISGEFTAGVTKEKLIYAASGG